MGTKMQTSFYSEEELSQIGFKFYGNNVLISREARFYSPHTIEIGNNVRIDDFCILSGHISIGSNIHIGPLVLLYGANGIIIEDFTGISGRTTIYSAMDDFGGDYLIGPIHPNEKTNVTGGPVVIRKYSQIGAHCLLFPNLEIGEGCVIGACSMVKQDTEPWTINVGTPVHKLKARSKGLLKLIY